MDDEYDLRMEEIVSFKDDSLKNLTNQHKQTYVWGNQVIPSMVISSTSKRLGSYMTFKIFNNHPRIIVVETV